MIGQEINTEMVTLFEDGARYGSPVDGVFVGLYRLDIHDGAGNLPGTLYIQVCRVYRDGLCQLAEHSCIPADLESTDAEMVRQAINVYDAYAWKRNKEE